MKKLLLSLFAVLTASFALGQTVTLDFTSNDAWNLPTEKTVDATAYSDGTYTITLTGSSDAGFYFNSKDKYLMLGKQDASLQFQAFDFAVGKIVVTGRAGASKATLMNVYVGENAASTETTGSADVNTYVIAEAYQAAGNIYTLKINSKHNAQIVKIEIYKVGEEGGGEPDPESIANTPETAYSVTKALELIAAGKDLGTKVYVAGKVTGTPSINLQYGNAEYDITDGTSTLKVYRGMYLGNVKFEAEDQLKEGDDVIIYGKLKMYNETPEFDQGNYIYSLNGETREEETIDYNKAEAISIAEFLTKADTKTMYKLTGVVRNIKSTKYGNFDLCDKDNEETKIYVYGTVKADDTSNNQIWESLGVVEGDILTIVGTYTTYNDAPQIVKAVYISHQNGGEPQVDITNTPETAYTTSKAKELIDEGKGLSANVYVKGTITKVGVEKDGSLIDLPGNSYGNATYFISDGVFELEVYRGYYLNNEKFTSEDQLKEGDEVIVYGQLTKFKETYEIGQGSYLYSLNGVTDGIQSVDNVTKDNVIYDLSGRRVEKATKGIYIVNGKKVVIK